MRIYDRFAIVVCVQVRPVARRRFGVLGDGKESKAEKYPVMVRDHGVWVPATPYPVMPSGVDGSANP
jgi:hypothetical protein